MEADTPQLANGYTHVNGTQLNAGMFLLQRLGLSEGMRVLDVGCGPGDLTCILADLVGEDGTVTGLDPSLERIAIAIRNSKSNLSFMVGRAENLSAIPSASMDAVFVNSTFHWVEDQVAALNEFARVLKPGGRLGMSGGSGDFVAAHEKIRTDVLSREPYKIYPQKSPPKFLKQRLLAELLQNAGFVNIKIVINTIVKTAKDGESMMEWLDTSSSGKTYGGIPFDLRPQAKEEMKREWAKITTENGINVKMELLVTVAFKS